MLCDALGNPLHFEVTAGAVPGSGMALPLLEGRAAGHILADKGCIKPQLFDFIKKMKAQAVIPSRKNQKVQRDYDRHVYKERNIIERLFSRLKRFRRVATRFDKRIAHYRGFIYLACSCILLR